MSCCGAGQAGANTCCNGRNINNFGRCSSEISGMTEATLNMIVTDVCQKKYRFTQDGKCGPVSGCYPPVDPCCPAKPRLRLRCPDPCRPLKVPIPICPRLQCPNPGGCYIRFCDNPHRPQVGIESRKESCCSYMIIRPLRSPCCPMPKKRCPPPPCSSPPRSTCNRCGVQKQCPKPKSCKPCTMSPCCSPRPTVQPIQIVGSCPGNCSG